MLTLLSAWEFAKKYILPAAVVASLIVGGYLLVSQTKDDLVKRLQLQQSIHDEEIKKINVILETERKQHEENIKKLQADLSAVQKKYDEQIKSLESRRTIIIDGLLKQFKTNPGEMAQQLSRITGFKLVMPEK